MIRRAWNATKSWFSQTWDDLKASADAGLLGGARFLGLIYGPIDRRLRIDDALRKALKYRLDPHVGWRQMFGGITYVLFMMLVVTGVLLALYYRPSVQEAYPSVQHIVSHVAFGWLIYNVHVWSASLIVLAVLAHMARVLLEAAYKPPRETNWTVGLLLLGVVLAFGASGYLLPWDQWAYWTVTEVLVAISGFPLFGGVIADALMGDVIVSGATLSRFFSLHVIVLPWISLALLSYHFTLVRRRGIAPPVDAEPEPAPWRVSAVATTEEWLAESREEGEPEQEGTPFFPDHLLRSVSVTVLVLALVVTLAVLFPRPFGNPADPLVVPDQLVSTWVPVDVSLSLLRYLGMWGFSAFTLLGFSLFLLPLFDRRPERRIRKRPVVAALGLVFFGGFIVLWALGRGIGSLPPSEGIGRAERQERVVPARSGAPVERVGPTPVRPQEPGDSGGDGVGRP
jgi:quinol-cytochrome oxidoreductase complex cytochrome b subunit